METLFLEDPSYEIREKEMEKIHEVLSRNRIYEAKSIFLKKMVYALIDATAVVAKTEFSIPEAHKMPVEDIEHEHLEFPRAKVASVAAPQSYRTQITEISSGPPPATIPKSPVLAEKLQQRISQRQSKVQFISRPQVLVQTKPPASLKPTLEEGIPIPTPPQSMNAQQLPPRRFDIQDLLPPSPPKLEGVTPKVPEVKIEPQKQKIEAKPKEISKAAPVQQKYESMSIESLPEIGDEEEILKIKSIPAEEQKYMPPAQFRQETVVNIEELMPEEPKITAQKSQVQPETQQIQPTVMKVQRDLSKQAFEIEHHPTENVYKELEPIERRFIPLHQEIELTSTPIQRKAQSIMPPPPRPTGGQIAKEQTGVSFLDINPRSGVREVEGNIQYEVADPFASPLQEVFEFIRLNVFVNPNKINDSKFLEESFKKMSKQLNITIQDKDKKEIIAKVNEYINGFGKIRDMLSDPSVGGIYCTGLNRPISVDFKLIGKITTNVVFVDKLELERLIKNMARMAGKSISESNPILDSSIPPNIKVEATLGGDFISSKFVIKKL